MYFMAHSLNLPYHLALLTRFPSAEVSCPCRPASSSRARAAS